MAKEKTQKYGVMWTVHHDGKTCEHGSEMTLDKKENAGLIVSGAVLPMAEAEKAWALEKVAAEPAEETGGEDEGGEE